MNKKIYFTILFLLISFFIGCNMSETLDEITIDYKESNINTKSIKSEETTLLINIINNADNILLKIDGYKIIGINGIDSIYEGKYNINYGDTIKINKFNINKQVLRVNSKIILKGELITNTNYTMFNDSIYIPINGYIKEGENVLNLELYGGCNWFDKNGNKLLHQINFNVTVNNWYEHENTVIFN